MNTPHQTEYSIRIRAAANGDHDQLIHLLLDIRHELAQFVRSRLGHVEMRRLNEEDVTEDVIATAVLEIKNLKAEDRTSFLEWLKRLAMDQMIKSARQASLTKRNAARIQITGTKEGFADQAFDLIAQLNEVDGDTPLRFAVRGEAIEAVNFAIANLPDELQKAVRLHFFEGLTLDETAERMERSQGSVRGLIHRAKRALRDSM